MRQWNYCHKQVWYWNQNWNVIPCDSFQWCSEAGQTLIDMVAEKATMTRVWRVLRIWPTWQKLFRVSFWMQVVPQFHNYENLIRAVRWQNLAVLWICVTMAKTCNQEIDARRRQVEDSNEQIEPTWPVYIIKTHWWTVFDNSWGGKVSAETWDKEIGKGTAAKLWTGSVLLPWLSPTSCCQLCCQAFDWNRSVAQPVQQDSL